MIVFIHIPKTAGTTFNRVVKSVYRGNFFKAHAPQNDILNQKLAQNNSLAVKLPGGYTSGPDQFDFIFDHPKEQLHNIRYIGGHIGYAGEHYKGIDLKHFTFVRSPLKRLVSDYKEHCKPGRRLYKDLKKVDFSFEGYLNLLLEYGMDNIMTRQLHGPYNAIREPEKNLSDDYLNQAFENSKNIHIAETENFEAGLYHLSKIYNWPAVKYTSENVSKPNAKRQNTFDLDSALVHEVTKYDILLYEKIQPQILNAPISFTQKLIWNLSRLIR